LLGRCHCSSPSRIPSPSKNYRQHIFLFETSGMHNRFRNLTCGLKSQTLHLENSKSNTYNRDSDPKAQSPPRVSLILGDPDVKHCPPIMMQTRHGNVVALVVCLCGRGGFRTLLRPITSLAQPKGKLTPAPDAILGASQRKMWSQVPPDGVGQSSRNKAEKFRRSAARQN
jgi:hypothetical protein